MPDSPLARLARQLMRLDVWQRGALSNAADAVHRNVQASRGRTKALEALERADRPPGTRRRIPGQRRAGGARVSVSSRADCVVVAAPGRVVTPEDIPALRTVILEAMAEHPAGVVCDLSRLRRMDPGALSLLPVLAAYAEVWADTSMALCCGDPVLFGQLSRLEPRTGVRVQPSLPLALDDAQRPVAAARLSRSVTPAATAAADARRFVRHACLEWHLGSLVDSASVVAGDLVARATAASQGDVQLRAARWGDGLVVSVRQRAQRRSTCRLGADVHLPIVHSLTTAWAVLPEPTGDTVALAVLARTRPRGATGPLLGKGSGAVVCSGRAGTGS